MMSALKILIFLSLFWPLFAFSSYPPVGTRKYIINEKEKLSIEKLDRQAAPIKDKRVKVYQDPIFDKKKFMKVLNLEREALMKRSKLVDEKSLIQMEPIHVKGRSANPRVVFETKRPKVEMVDRGLEVKILNKETFETQDVRFSDW